MKGGTIYESTEGFLKEYLLKKCDNGKLFLKIYFLNVEQHGVRLLLKVCIFFFLSF